MVFGLVKVKVAMVKQYSYSVPLSALAIPALPCSNCKSTPIHSLYPAYSFRSGSRGGGYDGGGGGGEGSKCKSTPVHIQPTESTHTKHASLNHSSYDRL